MERPHYHLLILQKQKAYGHADFVQKIKVVRQAGTFAPASSSSEHAMVASLRYTIPSTH